VSQFQYAERHGDSGRTECHGHRSDEQHLDIGEALHFLSGARKNDLRFQFNVAVRRKVLVNSAMHGNHGVWTSFARRDGESPTPQLLRKMVSKPAPRGSARLRQQRLLEFPHAKWTVA
jgi:hypothetical protein